VFSTGRVPNLIVLRIDYAGGVRLNDRTSQVMMLFNESKEARNVSDAAFRGIGYPTHPVPAKAHDLPCANPASIWPPGRSACPGAPSRCSSSRLGR
jgi:hypothetical protein